MHQAGHTDAHSDDLLGSARSLKERFAPTEIGSATQHEPPHSPDEPSTTRKGCWLLGALRPRWASAASPAREKTARSDSMTAKTVRLTLGIIIGALALAAWLLYIADVLIPSWPPIVRKLVLNDAQGQIIAATATIAAAAGALWTFFYNVWTRQRQHDEALSKDRELAQKQRQTEIDNAEMQRLQEAMHEASKDFGSEQMLPRINAVISVLHLAKERSNSERIARGRSDNGYPFFERACYQLSAALHCFKEREARLEVVRAMRHLMAFAVHEQSVSLMNTLIESLVHANRALASRLAELIHQYPLLQDPMLWICPRSCLDDLRKLIARESDEAQSLATSMSDWLKSVHGKIADHARASDNPEEFHLCLDALGSTIDLIEESISSLSSVESVVGVDLSKCVLFGIHLNGARLANVNVTKAMLSYATINGSIFNDVALNSVAMHKANVSQVEFVDCDFVEAEARDSLFMECSFKACGFERMSLERVSFRECEFLDCRALGVVEKELAITGCRSNSREGGDELVPIVSLSQLNSMGQAGSESAEE